MGYEGAPTLSHHLEKPKTRIYEGTSGRDFPLVIEEVNLMGVIDPNSILAAIRELRQ